MAKCLFAEAIVAIMRPRVFVFLRIFQEILV